MGKSSHSLFNMLIIVLAVQYVFMFQWPKLPELLFSMRDYKALEEMLCNQPKVS